MSASASFQGGRPAAFLRPLGRCLVPIVLVIVWQALGKAGILPEYLSYPSQVGIAFKELWDQGELLPYTRDTLLRLFGGFFVGSTLGVAMGLISGMSKRVNGFLDPLIAFVYPIPKIAFMPIAIMIFGIGSSTQAAIVTLSVSFPVFMATQSAVKHIDKHLVWVAENFEASQSAILFRVILPAVMPGVFAGLRIALALSYISLFAAELVGAHTGLSLLISEGQDADRFDIMLTGVVSYGVLGFISDRILLKIRSRVLKGDPS